MKLQHDTITDKNVITGYGPGHVQVNGADYRGNLTVQPDRIEAGWTAGGFAQLSADDFATLAALGCEVLLIGTGDRQRFPAPALLRPLIEARIGFEIMDVPAACRTYNILMGENRNVAVALLFDPD